MALFSTLLPTLIPLLIAILLYLILTFFLLPVYRRHRSRYSQYLPVGTPSYTTSNSPNSASNIFRRGLSYIHEHILFFPSLGDWHRRYGRYRHMQVPSYHTTTASNASATAAQPPPSSESEGEIFGEEEGESLVGFDLPQSRRAEQGRLPADVVSASSDRRLSRELEEGFRDDSSEEGGGGDGGRDPVW